jgi:hypothetical protein
MAKRVGNSAVANRTRKILWRKLLIPTVSP